MNRVQPEVIPCGVLVCTSVDGHTHVFTWVDRRSAEKVLFPEICRQASDGEVTWFFAARVISQIRETLA